MSGQTVGDIGEFGLIAALQPRLRTTSAVEVPSGDDAAVLRLGSDRLVVSTDMLVQDRHFRLEWSGPEDIGHKAAAQNFADLTAMGARPLALTAAVALPPQTQVDWVLGVVDGSGLTIVCSSKATPYRHGAMPILQRFDNAVRQTRVADQALAVP